MSSIRLDRGYTRREKISKFEGCYHGHADSLFVKAVSGLVTFGETSSAGVPETFARETLVAPLDNIDAVKQAFKEHENEIAAVIIEGIPADNGLLVQTAEYMHALRVICIRNKSLLILDEGLTGFRLGLNGADSYYELQPDLAPSGQATGGGVPGG